MGRAEGESVLEVIVRDLRRAAREGYTAGSPALVPGYLARKLFVQPLWRLHFSSGYAGQRIDLRETLRAVVSGGAPQLGAAIEAVKYARGEEVRAVLPALLRAD